jgi:hypothetical protein
VVIQEIPELRVILELLDLKGRKDRKGLLERQEHPA